MSNAYIKFNKTIERCKILVETFKQIKASSTSNPDSPVVATKDILRGAVVLAVAALDAYATDAFSEKFIVYIKHKAPDESLVNLLSNAGLDVKQALMLLSTDRPYRKIRTMIEKYYSKYTTQKFDVIDDLFLQYRIADITANAERRSGFKRLKRSVELLIERRHEIVHDGDYNDWNRIKDIQEAVVERRITDLEILVKNMDYILENKFSTIN